MLHYNEQARLYAKIAPQDYTDEQKIEFLNNAVAGVPGLCNVLTLNRQVRSGSGNNTPLLFAEYLQLLLDQAAVLDNSGSTAQGNQKGRRSVNVMEIEFSDGTRDTLELDEGYQVNVHDMDTPLEQLMAYQTDTTFGGYGGNNGSNDRPLRVHIDNETWSKMKPQHRRAWAQMPDEAKRLILEQGKIKENDRSNFRRA